MVDRALSGGERKRIELAAVLALRPKLAILDEPDSDIDMLSTADIIRVLDRLRSQGSAVLLITHRDEIAAAADRASQICGGQIICTGSPAEVAANFKKRRWMRSTMPVTPGMAAATSSARFFAMICSTSPSMVSTPSANSSCKEKLWRLTNFSRSRGAATALTIRSSFRMFASLFRTFLQVYQGSPRMQSATLFFLAGRYSFPFDLALSPVMLFKRLATIEENEPCAIHLCSLTSTN